MSASLQKPISEHTAEIRFQPNAKVLDYRGELATAISEHMSLKEWLIIENRVDIFDKEQLTRCFVSFHNAGVVMRNTQTADYFPNHATKFLRFALSQKPFTEPIFVQRLGVRSRFAVPVNTDFDTLLQKYQSKILHLTPEARKAFDADITDIGCPIVLSTENGTINSQMGVMEKTQLTQFFELEEPTSIPDIAFYIEFDYWTTPMDPMNTREISNLVKNFAQENWLRYERLKSLILENS